MKLFSPYRVREVELKNRIVVSPMCEYSAKDGHPQPWHMVHLGSRAVGGAALVFTEATAVEKRGRISAADTGIYEDAHVESWRPIARFIREQGAIPGMQLAHAGRKASTGVPWTGGKPVKIEAGGWEPVGIGVGRAEAGEKRYAGAERAAGPDPADGAVRVREMRAGDGGHGADAVGMESERGVCGAESKGAGRRRRIDTSPRPSPRSRRRGRR